MKINYERKVFDRYLTVDEERQLLRTVARVDDILAKRDNAWMRWARQSGVRVSVLAGMTVNDAREALRTHYFTVRGEINKGHKTYTLFVTKKGQQALRDLLRIRREMGHGESPDAPLIMSRNGKGMSVRSFQHRMSQWVKSSGLKVEATVHWFRHTKAMRIRQQSTAMDPVEVAQHALGQSCRKSAEIYSHPTREEMEQHMEESA